MKKNKPTKEILFLISILIVGAISARTFLYTGLPVVADALAHQGRSIIAYQELFNQMRFPTWSFFYYCGYPFLRFYAPLYYLLTSLLAFFAGGNVYLGNKICLFTLHIASGFSMYYLGKELFSSRKAAFIGAVSYLFIFWHLFQVVAMARYPAALFFTEFPLLMLFTIRLFRYERSRDLILLAITWGLLLISHHGYAHFSIYFFVLLAGFHFSVKRWRRHLIVAGIAFLGGVGIAAFSVIPLVFEWSAYKMTAGSLYTTYSPMVKTLVERKIGMPRYWGSGSYLGISILGLAIFGGISGIIRKNKVVIFCLVYLGISTLMTFNFKPLTGIIPFYAEFSGLRHLSFMILPICLLAASGFLAISELVKKSRVIFLICIVAILADTIPFTFHNYYKPVKEVLFGRYQTYMNIRKRPGGNRILDVGNPVDAPYDPGRTYRYPLAGMIYSGRAGVFGPFPQFAPRSSMYTYNWVNDLVLDIVDPGRDSLLESSKKVIKLLDIDYIIRAPGRNESRPGKYRPSFKKDISWTGTSSRKGVLPVFLGSTNQKNRVIFSSVARKWPFSDERKEGVYKVADDYQQLLDRYNIGGDYKADTLWVRTETDNTFPAANLEVTTLGFKLENQKVEVKLSSTGDCYIRLPFSYYDDLQATINGTESRIFPTADYFVGMRIPRGTSRIVLTPQISILRKACNLISIASLVLLTTLLVLPRKRVRWLKLI